MEALIVVEMRTDITAAVLQCRGTRPVESSPAMASERRRSLSTRGVQVVD
jgi:hypothetical protein